MKRIGTAGLCLVAVLALSAMAAASALAAAPEYKTCLKTSKVAGKYTGGYNDKACTSVNGAGEGKYALSEWNAGKKVTTKGKGGSGVNKLVNPFTQTVEGATACSSEKTAGEITGPKTSLTTVEYKGCKDGAKNCNSAGESKGKIKTNLLLGELVPLGSGSKVGILITSAANPGVAPLAAYECEGVDVTAVGAVIGEVSGNVGLASKTSTDAFEHGAGVMQKYLYAGGLGAKVEEESAIVAIELGAKIEKCVEKGEGSQSECETKVGTEYFIETGKAPPAAPTTLVSLISGEETAKAPSTQEATTNVKGESMLITAP